MKFCKFCNKNPVFSHDYCRVHQWKRTDEQYLKYKERKKQGKIPAKSKKRERDEKYYAENCKDLTKEIQAQNNGKVFCFFSGKEITPPVHYHHLKKRTGKFYTDKEWLAPSLDEYHLAWHDHSIEWLLKQDWYTKVFLPNLRAKSQELYDKEISRQEKSVKLNPNYKIEFKEDDTL